MTTQPAAERVAVREWTNDTKFRSDSPLTAMSLEHNAVVAALRAALASDAKHYRDAQENYDRAEAALADAARWKAALKLMGKWIKELEALSVEDEALTAPAREGENNG